MRADAPTEGATGAIDHPFPTLALALRGQAEARWIFLLPGTYTTGFSSGYPTHLRGLCAARVVLQAPPSTTGIDSSADIDLRDVTLQGGDGALHVTTGATATLRRVVIDGATNHGISVEGATLDAEDFALRNITAPRASGAISASAGAVLRVARASISHATAHALRIDGSGTRASLTDIALIDLRGNAATSGIGIVVRNASEVTATRVVVERATENCVYVTGGAGLTLTDAILRAPRGFNDGTQGLGLVVDGRGHADATRTLIEDCRQTAAVASGSGSELTLHACVIRRTATIGNGTQGTGIGANNGAQVSAEDTLVSESHDQGVIAYQGASSVTLTGCVIADTLPRRSMTQGVGVVSHTRASVTLRRTLVRGSHSVGVIAYGSAATVDLHDTMITQTLSAMADAPGAGLVAHSGGHVTGDHLALSNNIDAALESYGTGSAVTLEDVLIRPLDDGEHPRGLGALSSSGGTVTLRRAAVVGVDGVAVASLVGDGTVGTTSLTATDLFVSAVSPRTLWMSETPVAFGLSVERSQMALTRVTVLGGEVGFVVTEGTLTLDSAVVRDASRAAGVVNASPEVDTGTTTVSSAGGVGVLRDVSIERVRVPPPPPPGT